MFSSLKIKYFIKNNSINNFLIIRTYNNNVRVRFAPSPTGFLHLGGLRTALYNFLFAKRNNNGKFILRIEDTDQSRRVDGAVEQLQKDLSWAGIEIDEGPANAGDYGPYIQSKRLDIYRKHLDILLQNGSAYHCFCTNKRLDLLRKEALRAREVPKYDNRCRCLTHTEVESRLSKGDTSCIRFKLTPGSVTFNDLIYGTLAYDVAQNEGDPVIIKSDGYPTYHFANVVDDNSMKITHVLRGVEWQISTAKHLLLYKAFDWNPPVFGHLPLLLNADGSKLSKRQGDIQISHYKDSGVFPLALINFIVNSGGGFEKDLEKNLKAKCYTMEELSKQFNITRVNSHSGKLMPERLFEFNRLELKRQLENEFDEKRLIDKLAAMLKERFSDEKLIQTDEAYIKTILHWSINRISKLSDLFSKDLIFIWHVPNDCNLSEFELEKIKLFSDRFTQQYDDRSTFSREELNIFMRHFCEENDVKYKDFMRYMRTILSGLKEGPSVAEMIEILGKENTIKRLKACYLI